MAKLSSDVVIDGFNSDDVDFPACLRRSPMQQTFMDNIISPLAATMSSATETAVLLINAHADKVDEEGLTREQRRERELVNSQARGESAKAEVGRLVAAALAAQGLTVEDQMRERVQFFTRASGAAKLVNPADRLANRRVDFSVVRFVPA